MPETSRLPDVIPVSCENDSTLDCRSRIVQDVSEFVISCRLSAEVYGNSRWHQGSEMGVERYGLHPLG